MNQATGLGEVLGFVLELDELPCTGFVEFECARLSLMDASLRERPLPAGIGHAGGSAAAKRRRTTLGRGN